MTNRRTFLKCGLAAAGAAPVVICHAPPPALDAAVAKLDLLLLTGGEDI
ncbi:MAG: twin-arginine translocation signal domain-containing protein [Kiritimatiellae bacterium]|nr:twin-arginine translocation signal domain-containing protein [Kiritimatiellia bacterium]